MSHIKTIEVSHLGGINAAYQMPQAYDPGKPTLVMINSHRTTSDLYKLQFSDGSVRDVMNLVAIEPLGHGQTRTKSEHFTFWDTAIMNLQVLEALGIEKWFALGTSQGGWVVVRMALLAPEKVRAPLAAQRMTNNRSLTESLLALVYWYITARQFHGLRV